MKARLILFVFLIVVLYIHAQWSTDTYSPTQIATEAGEQALPKVAVHENGNTYISYFSNSSGSNKLRIKLLDSIGIPVWPEPVELQGAIFDTLLADYNLCVDQEGNAIVAVQDNRDSYSRIYAYKVSPSGQQLWGNSGLSLSHNASAASPDIVPVLLNTQDNYTYVVWQHQGTAPSMKVQRISPQGSPAWTVPLSISVQVNNVPIPLTWPQLVETNGNAVIIKYFLDMGSPEVQYRFLRTLCINPISQIVWEQAITETPGLSPQVPIIGFAPDGSGGAILSWHDDRNSDSVYQAFFSHISSSGVPSTPIGGVLISSYSIYQQFNPQLICDVENQQAQVIMRITDLEQMNSGNVVQVLDFAGNRMLGDTGIIWQNLFETDRNPLYAWNHLGLFHYLELASNNATPLIQRLSSGHNLEVGYYHSWSGGHIALTNTAKKHFDFAPHADGYVICVWEDGSSDADIHAQKYWYTGNVGLCNAGPANVTAEFIPPSSVHIAWDPPPFSAPLGYHVQLGDYLEMLPPTASEYTFTAIPPGHYQVFVRAIYEGGESTSQGLPYLFIDVVSNDDLVSNPIRLQIVPNPFRSSTRISWENEKAGKTAISLYNLRGQKVFSEDLVSTKGAQAYTLARGQLSSGIYFLRVITEKEASTRKLVLLP